MKQRKQNILEMDAEYKQLCIKLENAKKNFEMVDSISDLQRKQKEYQKQVDVLEYRKKQLDNDTKDLELDFQKLINNSHEKMVNIAFDGFMASKMLHAAACWETEEGLQQHGDIMLKVNNIPTTEKSPDELVEYLCRTIQIVRPTYNRNTIVNIAICLTQGYLQFFQGNPAAVKLLFVIFLVKYSVLIKLLIA